MTSIAVTPLVLTSIWVAADSRQGLLAQAPETAPVFKLPASLPSGTTVRVDGSSSMTLINEGLKQRFEEKFPGTTVTVADNGTDQALQALMAGTVDLVAVGRPLTEAEQAKGLKEIPISREKIAIIVSAENPFKGSVTAEQFAQMFRGEITNWSQVGGPDAPIRFIDRPASSDTRQALSQYPVFRSAPFQPGATATQVAADETAAVVRELGKDGIGYAIASQVLNQPNLTVLPMHDTLPSDPRYPYSQPRGYVYRGDANPGVQAFIGFATSPPGQEVVAAAKQQEAAAVQQPDPAVTTMVPDPPADATATAPTADLAIAAPSTTGQPASLSPLWWLLLPLLGLPLLLWLFKGRGGAMPPVVAATDESRLILTPRNCRSAYAYWEVPESAFAAAQREGGRDLKVRLYDVTDLQDSDRQAPHDMKEFDCQSNEPDLHVPIPVDNRDYLAELGYLTADNQWIRLARSSRVRVPACEPVSSGAGLQTAAVAGAAVTGAAVAARRLTTGSQVMEPSRVILVPRSSQTGYVYWEVPEARKTELKQAGGQRLMVRLHDITETTPEQPTARSVRQYECDERSPDLHVPIPTANRDYVAELGYVTQDNRWLSVAKSDPVHVPASAQGVVDRAAAIDAAAKTAASKIAADMDIAVAEAPPPGLTAKLGDVKGKVTGLAGDATKAVGAAIAGGTAAVAGFSPSIKSFLERDSDAAQDRSLQQSPDCRIILVPRSAKDAYAYWEVINAYKQALRDQGGRRLMLRIHDATNLDIDREAPHSTQTYVCNEADQDKHVVIPVADRDYIAELGYFTDDNRWLRLIRSFHVRVPANP